MNAHALLKYLPWHTAKKQFPPEAYSYDSDIDKDEVARIQEEANKVLDQQKWTVIETLGDGIKR